MKHTMKNKNNKTVVYYSAIMNVDKNTFDKMINKKTVKIGWSMCKVNVYMNMIRCFKCNEYNHQAKDCKQDDYTCPRCSGDHKIHECPNIVLKCCNCLKLNAKTGLGVPTNHYAWSDKCTVYQKKLQRKSSKITYEK